MTVLELSIAGALLAMVLTAVLGVMYGAQGNLDRLISRSESNSQIRLAAESIDREVRSGTVLYDPSSEIYAAGDIASGMSMRVYTASNSPTRGGSWCVQWRITAAGQLQSRRWTPQWTNASDPSQVSRWRTIATGLTNRTDGITAFALPSASTRNLVNIHFRVNNDATRGSTVEIQESVSGRNSAINANVTSPCGPQTPDPSLPGVPPYSGVPSY
jgi:hypothetical protein